MNSITSSYYSAPTTSVQAAYPIENNLGFLIDIPHTQPVSTPWYFGENPVAGRRELTMRSDPEMFAVDNVIPYLTPKIPWVDIQHASYNFNRAKHTYYI